MIRGGVEPSNVFLFSGHMVDAPDRPQPRFPPAMEPLAAARIAEALEQLGAGPDDIAFSQAAAGGDLLFLEACQARGVRARVLLPFSEAEFIKQSIVCSTDGPAWRARFDAMKAKLDTRILVMPDELGATPEHVNPYERCNLWLLDSAMAGGVDRVRLIVLWNGGGGDGPGGTAHMYEVVRRETGQVTWIDTRTL
jgi:hypothetical protein